MQVIRLRSPAAFLERAGRFLRRSEAEHNLMLGIGDGARSRLPGAYFAVVEDAGVVAACAMRTPPYKAVISVGSDTAIECVVDDLRSAFPDLPQVFGPEPQVTQFAALWKERTGVASIQGMRQQLFELREVCPLDGVPPGRLRPAGEGDLPILLAWGAAFIAEAMPGDPTDVALQVRQRIAARSLYVWENGALVSMAAWAGRNAGGVRVNFVYTPPEHRRHGYAAACVAQLSRQLLAEGQVFCCLFADLANATSNRIYRKIGYRPVSVFSDYVLNCRKR